MNLLKTCTAVLATALIFTLAGCNSKPKPGDPEEKYLADANTGDSLLYYYGQIRAYQYWHKSIADTNMRDPKVRERFLNGVHDGLYAVRENYPYYNQGLRLGMRMARSLYQFEKNYDIDLSRSTLYESIRKGLMDTTTIDVDRMQSQFYDVLAELNRQRDMQDKQNAMLTLADEAKKLNLTKVSDELYCRVVTNGHGQKVRRGDRINVSVNYTRTNGDGLGMPTPEYLTVGEGDMPKVLVKAYTMMQPGEAAIFATTSHALFGTRGDIIGLKPIDVILIHVTLTGIMEPGDKNPYDVPVDSILKK